jgi:hypothetical protein
VLIVDPGHTDTGESCRAALSNLPDISLKIVDLPQLPDAIKDNYSAVIWIGPQPGLYKEKGEAEWRSVVANKGHGLMIIGLPQDDPSVDSMIGTLADRGGPKIGIHLSHHLEKCFWIWTKEKKGQPARLPSPRV